MFAHHLEWGDYLALVAIAMATFACVVVGNRLRDKVLSGQVYDRSLENLLMGRSLTAPLFVATLVATWYGGIFGTTQLAFDRGVFNFVTQGIFWYLSYFIFALFIVPRLKGYAEARTLPDILRKNFGPRSERLGAVFNVLDVIPIAYVVALGIFLSWLVGIDPLLGSLIGLAFTVGYSLIGGFRAVVFSDLFQFGVMFLSVILVVAFSVANYGGYEFLRAKLPASHFNPTGGDLSQVWIWGFIALTTLADPNFYHRCFAAKNLDVARSGILLSTLFWCIFDICTTLGGMYARAVLSETSAKFAYLEYAVALLPSPLRGIFLAGVLMTILSTLDSYLFIGSATLSTHIISPRFVQHKRSHALGVVGIAGLALFFAQFFSGNIYEVWKTLGSYSSACLLAPLLCAFLIPGQISDNAFVSSCLLGVVSLTVWKIRPWPGFEIVDEFYLGLLGSSSALLFFFAVGQGQKLRARFKRRV